MHRAIITAAILMLAACNAQPTSTATSADASTTSSASSETATSADADAPAPAGAPCDVNAQPSGDTLSYTCGAKHFSVRYDSAFTCAFVSAGGQSYRVGAAVSASGSRYSDGHVEYWEHHGDGLLTGAAGGPYDDCHAAAS